MLRAMRSKPSRLPKRSKQAASPSPADVALAQRGAVDQPQHGFPVFDQGDQRGEERDPAREGDGAVDGIHHPEGSFVDALLPEFLTQDPEIRVGAAQRRADHPLGGPVRLGDG
jgi:hypothetical protein